jgi:hypothetical protein
MNKLMKSISYAWQKAANDLEISIISPFEIEFVSSKIQYPVLVKDFGCPKGTLIIVLRSKNEEMAENAACSHEYYYSIVGEHVCNEYDRTQFINILNDWGYFGPKSNCPKWYTGKSWT